MNVFRGSVGGWVLAGLFVVALISFAFYLRSKRLAATAAAAAAAQKLKYPKAARGTQVDNYHGTVVADPYRWMEDVDSADTRAWIEAENAVTKPYLSTLPGRAALHQRLSELINFPRLSLPSKYGKRWFWYANTGLQNQDVLYVGTGPKDPNPAVLLDPNTLSTDGTVALSQIAVSPDGNLVAYAIARSGSDWIEWHVRDVAAGKDLPDVLKWSKFSGASWTKDGLGFFYCRYAEPDPNSELKDNNFDQKLLYHKLGDPQSADVMVYERPDHKDWMFGAAVSDDGKYLVIEVQQASSTRNALFVKDLAKADNPVVELFGKFDANYNFVDNVGSLLYITTNLDAPLVRLVSVDVNAGAASLKEVVRETDATLQGASYLDGKFVLTYLQDARSQVKIHNRDGSLLREVSLPGIGTISGFGGKADDYVTYFKFISFNNPGKNYEYDLRTGVMSDYYSPKLAFNPDDFVTEQVFYASKDGTKVPMFICYKKGLKKDGSNPTYLYGYGGFSISLTPSFSSARIAWMEQGGIFAMPNLRGGGEYGEPWHLAGTKVKKQNVFDDFISAAEWLIANGYTSTPKLAIGGGSNGGLLVGACLVQRPDLYGAAIPEVGVLDMLRYSKFTIGWAWTPDYGSTDNVDEFKALYAYSPVHNVKAGTAYPPTMVMTADHDDRVFPAHSFKFAAALQAAQAGPAPVIIRIETKAGHGAGTPVSKQIDAAADRWSFLLNALK